MYTPFNAITKASQLWEFDGPMPELVVTNDSFSMEQDGVVYSCSLETQGDITIRKDQIVNTNNTSVTIQPHPVKYMFPGGDYEIYTQYNILLAESCGDWQKLVTQISSSCNSFRTARTASPFMVLWNNQCSRGTVFHLLPNSNWNMTASRIWAHTNHEVQFTAGFYGNPVITLAPGETVNLPTVLSYSCRNKLDMDAWKIHRWFNKYFPREKFPVVYNTWLYRFDHFTPDMIASQIPAAAELGVEYFVVDAGWFGVKGKWSRTVGDWVETPESAMSGCLGDISRLVRENGMKFGLWFEIERATAESKIVQEHPEYFVPGVKYLMLNFARQDVRNYVHNLFDDMIEKYTIDYIKFDLNYDMCTIENDPAMHLYFVGWRQFLVELKERHPGLYMECCASGGMRADLNNLMYFDSVWITDNQSPYHTMRIYKDGLRRLPPQVLERWGTFISLKDFRPFYREPYCGDKMIATDDSTWSNIIGLNPSWLEGMVFGGPFGLSCDITSFTDALKAQIKGWVEQIKVDREYWKKVECRILCDTKDTFVLEYTDEEFSTIHLFAYTLHRQQTTLPVFPIVDVDATYSIDEQIYTGVQLDEKGLLLEIEDSNTCKHVVLKKV